METAKEAVAKARKEISSVLTKHAVHLANVHGLKIVSIRLNMVDVSTFGEMGIIEEYIPGTVEIEIKA